MISANAPQIFKVFEKIKECFPHTIQTLWFSNDRINFRALLLIPPEEKRSCIQWRALSIIRFCLDLGFIQTDKERGERERETDDGKNKGSRIVLRLGGHVL